MEYLELLKYFVAIIIGAAGSGIPLYRQLRKIKLEVGAGNLALRKTEQDNQHKQEVKQEDLEQKRKINAEAEWKRIIEFRDAELVRLRERDDQQEKQLLELWNKHIDCERKEAAQGVQIQAQEKRIDEQRDRIVSMEKQLSELLTALVTRRRESDAHERQPTGGGQ